MTITPVAYRWTDTAGYNADYRYSTCDPRENEVEVEDQNAQGVMSCDPLVLASDALAIISKDREVMDVVIAGLTRDATKIVADSWRKIYNEAIARAETAENLAKQLQDELNAAYSEIAWREGREP